MRLVFAGTPEPAVPSLAKLVGSHHDVVAVITRPDARAGRGRHTARSPVAGFADEKGIPLLQPRRPSDPDFLAQLRELEPDVCPVVAYGALLPPEALAVPRVGWVNLHFSLLPAWRGAAPVQHAIRHGDDVTGASTFLIEAGMDTGPVFGVVTETIRDTDTSGDLLQRLSESGAGLLLATLDGIESGEIHAVPQSADGITLAPKVTVDDARIDWKQPAVGVDRLVRSCTPEPGAWTTLDGQRVKILPLYRPVSPVPDPSLAAAAALPPGELLRIGKHRWLVGTASDPLELDQVHPQGKRVMAASDWLRGLRVESGVRFD